MFHLNVSNAKGVQGGTQPYPPAEIAVSVIGARLNLYAF